MKHPKDFMVSKVNLMPIRMAKSMHRTLNFLRKRRPTRALVLTKN
jgi:hypothetical protein